MDDKDFIIAHQKETIEKQKDVIITLCKAIKGMEIFLTKDEETDRVLGEYIKIPEAERILLKDAFKEIKKLGI